MIPVNKFKLLTSDRKIILNALKRNWISSAGPEVKKFEDSCKDNNPVNKDFFSKVKNFWNTN